MYKGGIRKGEAQGYLRVNEGFTEGELKGNLKVSQADSIPG